MIQLMLLFAALISAGLASIVLANNVAKAINRVYFFLSITATLWLCANAFVLNGPLMPADKSLYLFIGRLITPTSIALAYLLTLFVIFFIFQKLVPYRKWLIALALPGMVIVCLSFTSLNVYLGPDNTLQLGSLSLPFSIITLGYLLLGIYVLLFKLRHRKDEFYKIQAKYLRRAFLISVIPSALLGVILPLFTTSDLINLGPLFSLIFLFYAALLILKHKLFDVRPIVAKVIAYALLLATTIGFFAFFAIFVTRHTLHITNTFVSQELIPFILSITLAVLFGPAKKFFDRLTNRLFFQDAYDPQQFLDELNKTILASIDINKLLTRSQQIIEKNLKSGYLAFVVYGTGYSKKHIVESIPGSIDSKVLQDMADFPGRGSSRILYVDDLADREDSLVLKRLMSTNRVGAIARLSGSPDSVHKGVGVLILGEKKSGSPYNGQDRRVLEIVVSELVIAIQNSLRFEEIQNFNATLQDKVEEATRKLRSTNDKLRKLDETKDDFISMASHQLRTPLTSVKGYVSMVLDGDAGKISTLQRKLLTQSFISSQRMVYLISDLLNVSRLKTGKFIIEAVPTNLANVIDEEIEQLQETAKGRNLELSYRKPEHFPTLMLDETKIRQVIMNFIDNAVYYTPSGGHITINLVDQPRTIEFTVVDDGIGVAKHEQPHLFTKFFRAHNAKRARPDGTGLGLFMAKKVIVASGGALVFKSQEGRGSTFGFTFAKDRLMPPAGKPTEVAKPNPIHVNPANK
jgi:signal transduction histidine kinase